MRQIVIIGAGASGLTAAVKAAEGGAKVTVLEMEDRPGRKLLRTGNGRCNLANAADPAQGYEGRNPEFPAQVLRYCPVSEILAFFRRLGVETRELSGWYYPGTEEARTVLAALLRRAGDLGVKIKLRERVTSIRRAEGRFSVLTETWKYPADAVILACGSPAGTQSDSGSMFLAEELGLASAPLRPALVSLRTNDPSRREWAGARARAEAVLYADGKEIYREAGQIQFTKEGVSGIPVFNMSCRAGQALQDGKRVEVRLDFLKDLDRGYILREAEYLSQSGDAAGSERLIAGILPEKLAGAAAARMKRGISAAGCLTAFSVEVTGTGSLRESQAAAGGVLTEEADPSTMMCVRIPGLYLIGEVLEPVGHCGGYNLQFAWAGGLLAGRSACEHETDSVE